jgi:putative transposase
MRASREVLMKKKRFTEEQIAYALRRAESDTPVEEICRQLGIGEPTFCRWKRMYTGMGVAELRRLKLLEQENKKLKQLVADLSLDKQMLQDVLKKSPEASREKRDGDVSSGWLPKGVSQCPLVPDTRVDATEDRIVEKGV